MNEWIENYGDRPTGYLPRTKDPGTVCALAADRLSEVYARKNWDALLAEVGGEVDFSDCCHGNYDQNGFGSCGEESLHKAIEAACRLAGQVTPELNPWWGYGIRVRWRGGPNVGTDIDGNLALAMTDGCCPADIWPRSKGPNVRPPEETYAEAKRFIVDEAYDCTNVEEVWTCLYKRWPCVIGWRGHAECLVGLQPGGRVKVWGSYGPTYYGGKGWHIESIDAIDFRYGAVAIRTVVDRII